MDKNAKERLKTNFSSASASKMVQPMQIMMDLLKEQWDILLHDTSHVGISWKNNETGCSMKHRMYYIETLPKSWDYLLCLQPPVSVFHQQPHASPRPSGRLRLQCQSGSQWAHHFLSADHCQYCKSNMDNINSRFIKHIFHNWVQIKKLYIQVTKHAVLSVIMTWYIYTYRFHGTSQNYILSLITYKHS